MLSKNHNWSLVFALDCKLAKVCLNKYIFQDYIVDSKQLVNYMLKNVYGPLFSHQQWGFEW